LASRFAQTLIDRDGRAGIEFGVTGVPETYLVDGDGRVARQSTPARWTRPTRSASRSGAVNPGIEAKARHVGALTIIRTAHDC